MRKIELFACSFCGFITASALTCMVTGAHVSRWTLPAAAVWSLGVTAIYGGRK